MKLTINFKGTEMFLATKRCRTELHRPAQFTAEIDIKEAEELPVAFRVTKYGFLFPEKNEKLPLAPGTTCIRDHHEGCWGEEPYDTVSGFFVKEVCCFDGELYQRSRKSDFECHGLGPASVEDLKWILRYTEAGYYSDKEAGRFTEGVSVITGNDRDKGVCQLQAQANRYLIVNGVLWEKTSEPRYVCMTFGLGHNHASTTLTIAWYYNENIPYERYFNALQRKEAVEYAKQLALRRGDTDSIPRIENETENIEVLMPEMVKLDPRKDYGGPGCAITNQFEGLIENTGSTLEAGLLSIAAAAR